LNTTAGMVPVSWTTALLPYIDQQNVFDQWKQGQPVAPYLEVTACPSDPQDRSRASTSYVVNCGLIDKNPRDAAQVPLNWPSSTFVYNLPADWPANGPFVSRYEPGVNAARTPRVNESTFYDGMGNTFLITENIDATVWNDVVSLAEAGNNGYVQQGNGTWNTPEIQYGFVWTGNPLLIDSAGQVINQVINGPTSENGEATEMSQCRPSSRHPGGVNMTFADGRTQFISDNIDYQLYSLLMTPEGRKSTPNGQNFIPTPSLPAAYQPYVTWRTQTATSGDLP
jgi:prepilin-type processing-associated H-X9-DG protein